MSVTGKKKQRIWRGSDGDDARYSFMPARIVEDERVSKVHWRLMGYLGRVNNNYGWVELSQTELAAAWGYHRRSVTNAVAQLVKWNYIEKRGQAETGGSRCHYRTLIDAPVAADTSDPGDPGNSESDGNSGECHVEDDTGECHAGDDTSVMQEMTGVSSLKAHIRDLKTKETPPPTPSLSTEPSTVDPQADAGTGGEEIKIGFAKGWCPSAQEEIQMMARSPLLAPVATEFITRVCGTLRPTKGADAPSLVRQLGHKLRNFDADVLRRLAEWVLDERGHSLPGTDTLVAQAKNIQPVVAHERLVAQSGAAANPDLAQYRAPLIDYLKTRLTAPVVRNWFSTLQLQRIEGEKLICSVAKKHFAKWITTNFWALLDEAAAATVPGVTMARVVDLDTLARRSAAGTQA